ncbi:MAG TPA: EscU/YscU/HrcU family type III secretion system export apparatus switch protein [Marinagarivorans sp.]
MTHNEPSHEELAKAVALFYDGEQAPTVVAKGTDDTAAAIIALAQEHKVPICNNPALAELLTLLDIGDHIPKELYVAIAHIISFAYQLRPNGANPADN